MSGSLFTNKVFINVMLRFIHNKKSNESVSNLKITEKKY